MIRGIHALTVITLPIIRHILGCIRVSMASVRRLINAKSVRLNLLLHLAWNNTSEYNIREKNHINAPFVILAVLICIIWKLMHWFTPEKNHINAANALLPLVEKPTSKATWRYTPMRWNPIDAVGVFLPLTPQVIWKALDDPHWWKASQVRPMWPFVHYSSPSS